MNSTTTPIFFHTAPGSLPPAYQGYELAYALAIFGMLGVMLISFAWIHKIIWDMIERPAALNAPATASRVIMMLIQLGILFRIAPDVIGTMFWPDVLPATRQTIAWWNRIFDTLSILPHFAAFTYYAFAGPVLNYQLFREPLPVELWPRWRSMGRLARMMAGVLAISIIVSYARDARTFRSSHCFHSDHRCDQRGADRGYIVGPWTSWRSLSQDGIRGPGAAERPQADVPRGAPADAGWNADHRGDSLGQKSQL